MTVTAADFLMERLLAWGVRRIFGYPGDGINGLVAAIARTKGKLDFIQVRHEEQAAFMASAHAKFTGEVGVCLATSGPGAIHLLNGLYDAKMDHQPVVAIVGQASTMALGGNYQQEVDLNVLFKDVASEYCFTISNPVAVRHVVDRALRIAMATRSVTCMIVPKDVADMDAVPRPPHTHNTVHTGIGFSRPRIVPSDTDLQRAAAVLNDGSKVAMLVGAGAMNAADEVIAVADRLGAGCAKALLGKAVLPDDLPWVTGTIGLLGTRPSNDMMRECDTLLMIGSTFPYGEFLPKEGQARGVQIDIDGKNLSLRYPMEVNLDRRCRRHADGASPATHATGRSRLARAHRVQPRGVDASQRQSGQGQRESPQSGVGVHRALAAAAGQLHLERRCRDRDELAGAASRHAARDEVLAVGQSRDDGAGRAVCDRREVRISGPRRDRADRRRRDADERHQRADHGGQVLEAVA